MYTAIVPARDDEPYIAEAIVSIFGQALAPVEVIVCLDPDARAGCNTEKVVESWGERVTVVRSVYPGMISALNKGIELVRTPFVAFLDSDDVWVESKQERQIEVLFDNPEIDVSTSKAANFRVASRGEKITSREVESILFTGATFRTEVFESFGTIDPLSTHHTWLYRWWSRAMGQGIRRESTGILGVLRRIHSTNSWVTEKERAHQELMDELRRILCHKRGTQEIA